MVLARFFFLLLLPGIALAQPAQENWTPPPLIEAQPEGPAIEPAPAAPVSAPSAATASLPARTEPPPEIGLMVTEVAFGALTAAGTALIPYYLLLKPLTLTIGTGANSSVTDLIFILLFSAVPLAVSQTELSLAAGSRYFEVESWPPALFGLLAQGAVLGLYYLLGAGATGSAELALLVGTLGFVPIAEMMAINLMKTPRQGPPPLRAVLSFSPEGGLAVSAPVPAPIFSHEGTVSGLALPLAAGRF